MGVLVIVLLVLAVLVLVAMAVGRVSGRDGVLALLLLGFLWLAFGR